MSLTASTKKNHEFKLAQHDRKNRRHSDAIDCRDRSVEHVVPAIGADRAGDASKTAQNILASEELFRLGMIGDAIIFLLEVALTVVLYDLLKPVSKTMSLLAVFARVSLNDIQALNLLSSFLILQLRSNSSFLRVFTTDQLHAFMLMSLNAQQDVVLIWGLFLALHMFVLGYLV